MTLSGSGSADLYLWVMDPAPTPDPTPDPTPFFSDFKDAKKISFFFLYLTRRPQAHYLQSYKLNFCWRFILQALFQSAQHLYEKKEGSSAGSVPLTNGSEFRIREAHKHADPANPDPQHRLKLRVKSGSPPVWVEVELGEVCELPEWTRKVWDVGFAQVQSLLPLFPAG